MLSEFIYSYSFFVNTSQILQAFYYCIFYGIIFILLSFFLTSCVIGLVLAERKVLAFFTLRYGPNRVGPYGTLQTVADGIKILFKEDILSTNIKDKFLFFIAPVIFFAPTICCFALLPLNNHLSIVQSDVSALLLPALLLISTFAQLLAGYSSNNKYSLIGAIRSICQTLSYELPMLVSILTCCLTSSSLNINDIILSQSGNFCILNYNFIQTGVAFIIFFICMLAQMNRCPFDLCEAESEIISGYHTEYSSMKFAMFFLNEYTILLVNCMFFVTIFFAGYLPLTYGFYFSDLLHLNSNILYKFILTEQTFWLFFKTIICILIVFIIRATLPRLKYSQLLIFSWKFLFPISIINFIFIFLIRFILNGV